MYTGPRATKETQNATSVPSTTRTAGKSQPFLSTAEIDSIVPGMKAVQSDGGHERTTQSRGTVPNFMNE